MAEKDASLAIENAVQRLDQEANIGQRVQKLDSLRSGLRRVSFLLKDFNLQQDQDERNFAEWLGKVRAIAYDSKNVIDTIAVNTLQRRRSWLVRLFSGQEHKNRCIERQITDIERRINDVSDVRDGDGVVGGFNGGDGSSKVGHGHSTIASFERANLVGLNDDLEAVVTQITADVGLQFEVITIVGKAGSGKTTLAKLVYNDSRIEARFGYRGWVHVSQELQGKDLLWRVAKRLGSVGIDRDGSEEELKAAITESLKAKKYLIVLDNVWSSEVWEELQSVFPDEANGSRILLVTTLAELALNASQIMPFAVNPLDREQSWELLWKKVFEGENSPPDLEKVGREIAGRCNGLPRAILTLAAILSNTEKTIELWSKFVEDSDDGGQQRMMIVDYHEIPDHLKLCFLSFGSFPEGFYVRTTQLIQMWVAEGFLVAKGSKEPEEIGEDYLEELISRSLVQVGKKRSNGRAKTCCVSSYIRRLCVAEGAQQKLFEVRTGSNNSTILEGKCRLAIHSDFLVDVLSDTRDGSQVLSLQCYGATTASSRLWKILCSGFSSLLVLNLGSVKLDKVPNKVGKLIHLRYLKLWATDVTHITSSIGNLQNLQTLDLRETRIHSIPHEIWKMKFLRHLYLARDTSLPDPKGVNYYKAMLNLRTLSGVRLDTVLNRLMVKAKFPNVTRLGLCSPPKPATSMFLNSLDHLFHLQSLKVENPTSLPDQNAFPLTLSKVTLLGTKLEPNSIMTLEMLPNLKILKLMEDSILGSRIECSAGGFLQLQVLYLVGLEVEKWEMSRGGIQCLKHLVIEDCCGLVAISEELWQVSALQDIHVVKPTQSLRQILERLKEKNEGSRRIFIDPHIAARATNGETA